MKEMNLQSNCSLSRPQAFVKSIIAGLAASSPWVFESGNLVTCHAGEGGVSGNADCACSPFSPT